MYTRRTLLTVLQGDNDWVDADPSRNDATIPNGRSDRAEKVRIVRLDSVAFSPDSMRSVLRKKADKLKKQVQVSVVLVSVRTRELTDAFHSSKWHRTNV